MRAKAEAAAKAAGETVKIITIKADVASEEDVKKMFAAVIEEFGSLDVLINNSGIQKPASSDELEMADWDKVIGVNLRGAFLCAREAIRHFLARKAPGSVVFNSSVHEIIPKPKYVPYSISKGGMENMTKTLALEYADRNIRVNAVGPGAIVTPINMAWINDPKAKAEVVGHIPMGRAGTSEEIAGVVCVHCLRRRFVYHGPNAVCVRRLDSVSRIQNGLVFRGVDPDRSPKRNCGLSAGTSKV